MNVIGAIAIGAGTFGLCLILYLRARRVEIRDRALGHFGRGDK